MLHGKGGISINAEVVIAALAMADSLYSLTMLGKCGPKVLFDSVKRADPHALVGTVAQEVCDLFQPDGGYVVIRVQASRDDTGGPFRDIALVDPVSTLDDLKYRNLVCSFDATIPVRREPVNIFTAMMENATSKRLLLPPKKESSSGKKDGLSAVDSLYNKTIDLFQQNKILFHTEKEGEYILKVKMIYINL